MSLTQKIKAILSISIYFWKHPHPLNESMFKMMAQLMEFILKVAKENKPYMCEFGLISTDEESYPIVSLWAGAGTGSDPLKRIKELNLENEILKTKISRLLSDQTISLPEPLSTGSDSGS